MNATIHLLRRVAFAPTRRQALRLSALPWEQQLALLVDQAPRPRVPSELGFANVVDKSADRDFAVMLRAELSRLATSRTGLGDRMLWFWHGLLTTAHEKVYNPGLQWRQHRLIAKHALGSFRDLLIQITLDPAMLIYLDGEGSEGAAPNENYARELMELFSLGRGNYTQADVRAAAKGLAGWYLQHLPDSGRAFSPSRVRARFDPDAGFREPQAFLGKTTILDVVGVVDRILEQQAAARFIVTKLFTYFVHSVPPTAAIDQLAATFRGSGYQIRPLLSALFRRSEFLSEAALAGREKLPLETLLTTATALAMPPKQLDYWTYLDAAGQMPFDPPNVAGWPLGKRWISGAPTLARVKLAAQAFNLPKRNPVLRALGRAHDPVTEVIDSLLLADVSDATRGQLETAAGQVADRFDRARLLLALALAAPEFALT